MFNKTKRLSLNFISILFFLFSLILCREVSADEIVLKNGDRITGTVIKAEKGMVTLKTEYSEPIHVDKEQILSISTNKPIEIHLENGEVLKGRLMIDRDGKLTVESSAERESTAVDWNKVAVINPTLVIPSKWKGNITLGANIQSGNTDRSTFSIGAEATRKTDQDRFSLHFLYNYAEEDEKITARNIYGSLKYDYFFKKSLYGYLSVEMLNDKFKDLDLRTVVGPGVGYQIWDDPIKFLLFEGGISLYSEDLKEGDDEQWITGRLAGNFSYTMREAIIFSDHLILYPSLKEIGEYQLRNEAAITSALGSRLALKLSNIFERDSDPPKGVEENDLYWILALQYSF